MNPNTTNANQRPIVFVLSVRHIDILGQSRKLSAEYWNAGKNLLLREQAMTRGL
jgi:hypothetical protein